MAITSGSGMLLEFMPLLASHFRKSWLVKTEFLYISKAKPKKKTKTKIAKTITVYYQVKPYMYVQ